ncbi:hypothetical protein Tco_0518473, partial [Tanacetum coccineum]
LDTSGVLAQEHRLVIAVVMPALMPVGQPPRKGPQSNTS